MHLNATKRIKEDLLSGSCIKITIGIGCDGFHILDWRNFEIRCSFNSHRLLEEISFAHQVLSPSTVINKYNNGPDHDDCIHKHKLNN